ncbi:MAG: hypothetical protein QOF23_1678 [Solirubrobacterales bacterium]|nr:hypothetical protein [Solirubrobacterales bacterium]
MIGTYAAVVAVCGASLAIGQAAIALCGARGWSWLSPAVGLALLCAICWGTVRLPGDGAISAIAVLVLTIASVAYLWNRLEGGGGALRAGWPVALGALVAASLPFVVEGHFGILGTGFNPDMSQHLLATDRLAEGQASQLLNQGYPLGPHAIVVALNKGLGIGLVQGFSGLTVAVAVLAPLTALAAFRDLRPVPRTAAALLVGLTYVVASYFAQGAFKETMQALFLLAFVLSLREATRSWHDLPLRFVPCALLAVGSIYTYSFPGLIWLGGTFLIWAIVEAARTRTESAPSAGGGGAGVPRGAEGAKRPSTVGDAAPTGPAVVRSVLFASLLFAVLVAPEIGRMIDFRNFETFNPNGPGLGNLFGQVSPFEALGIWPSGDFRLAPGDGAVPAAGYYLGAAFALALFLYGLARCRRRRETAILAGVAAAALAYIAARVGGTPYTAAKAIEIASPLVALAVLAPLLDRRPSSEMAGGGAVGGPTPEEALATAGGGGSPAATGPAGVRLALALFLLAAGVCSLLAFANAPVGPTAYSPALTGLRPLVADSSTLVLAPDELLAGQHGTPYIAWELRGGRVCIAAESENDGTPPPGVRFVVTTGDASQPPYPYLRVRRIAPPYVLWEVTEHVGGKSPCPLIAVRQARQGPAR